MLIKVTLVSFQLELVIYNSADIEPNEQLLYDYGKSYWEKLGIEPHVLL